MTSSSPFDSIQTLSGIPNVLSGEAAFLQLLSQFPRYGQHVFLVTGGASFRQSLFWEKLMDACQQNHVRVSPGQVTTEPSPEIIDQLRDHAFAEQCDFVVAIGGGSVLDAGKAVAAMVKKTGESVKDYLEGVGDKMPDGERLPLIAVPTTAGTGSEATKNAVISEVGESGFKKSFRHERFIPDLAVLDPLLTKDCPPELTAFAGMDAFTQLMESYLSSNASPFSDALAWDGIQRVCRSLPEVFLNGDDLQARFDMQWAAFFSGVTLANAGLGTVHGFASPVGAMVDIPHGIVCANLMAPVNRANVEFLLSDKKLNPLAYEKYVQLGRLFSGKEGENEVYYLNAIPDFLNELKKKLKVPSMAPFFGNQNENLIHRIVAKTNNKNNPVDLSKEQQVGVLKEALRNNR